MTFLKRLFIGFKKLFGFEVEGPPETFDSWVKADGTVHRLSEMSIDHVFNCMRMLYDHIAWIEGWPRMRPDGSGLHIYAEFMTYHTVMRWIATFIQEIFNRQSTQFRSAGLFGLSGESQFQFATMVAILENKAKLAIPEVEREQINKILERRNCAI